MIIILELEQSVLTELLTAIDVRAKLAHQLIDKLINETNQPEKSRILNGEYYLIRNADIITGEQYLSDRWSFDVHGEHCLFEHQDSGQRIEVSLGRPADVSNIDPYFFYDFLHSSTNFQHLALYFTNPFNDMLEVFEHLTKQDLLVNVHGNEYRKLKLQCN